MAVRVRDANGKIVASEIPLETKVQLSDGIIDVAVTPEGELKTAAVSQVLFEDHFNESPINSVIWDQVIVGGGAVTVEDSFVKLTTTTAASDAIEIHAKEVFRHIFSRTFGYRSGIRFLDINQPDCEATWGMHSHPISDDGWWFCLTNGVLEACTSFNGVVTSTNIDSFKPTDGNVHRYDAVYRNYKVVFMIDFVIVHTADAQALPLFAEERLTPFFALENLGTSACSMWVEGMGLFDDASTGIRVFGFDGNLFRNVAVTTDGRLLVSSAVTVPPGADLSREGGEVTVAKQGGTDTFDFTIPNGKTLELNLFKAGAFVNKDISDTPKVQIRLIHDPAGTGVGQIDLDQIMLDSTSDSQHDQLDAIVGDGTARIRMITLNWTAEPVQVWRQFVGILKDTP